MNPEQARALLEETGAMLSGHFLLSSGRHSNVYVEKARVLERPSLVTAFAAQIASWYPRVDVVVSPAVGALVLGFAVALSSGARFVFAEREERRMSLRRGFHIAREERTLVVEDVITTGGSAREVWELVGTLGASRLGVAVLVDRSRADVAFPLRAVLRVDAASWDSSECPMCREGVAVQAPGSRHLAGSPERSPSSRG